MTSKYTFYAIIFFYIYFCFCWFWMLIFCLVMLMFIFCLFLFNVFFLFVLWPIFNGGQRPMDKGALYRAGTLPNCVLWQSCQIIKCFWPKSCQNTFSFHKTVHPDPRGKKQEPRTRVKDLTKLLLKCNKLLPKRPLL